MKRLIAGITLLVLTAGGVYGYMVSRRERTYGRVVTEGEAALASGNYSAAVEAFSGAIALKPEAMLGHLKRGEAYRRRGELDPAERDLLQAAELDPTATQPQEQLGDVALAERHYASAADRYRAYVRIDDRAPRVLYKLAYAEYNAGRPAAALDPLQKALAMNDRLAEGYYLLGVCQRALQRTGPALMAFERALTIQPTLFRAREELADLYGAEGKTDKRLDQLEALAALDPGPARAIGLGLAYARAGQSDRAVLTLARACERYPDQQATYLALGRVWLQLAQDRNDRVALSKAMGALEGAMAGENTDAMTLFGRALLLAHDPASAERMLAEATRRRPVEPAAYVALADAAEQSGDYAAARDALLDYQAISIDDEPRRVAAEDARLAKLSLRLKDPGGAVKYYLAAAEAAHDSAYLVDAAEAQLRSGATDAAAATLQRALDRDPHNARALSLKHRLPTSTRR
jgi:tetratricopeptide (TPR) repeat protein